MVAVQIFLSFILIATINTYWS